MHSDIPPASGLLELMALRALPNSAGSSRHPLRLQAPSMDLAVSPMFGGQLLGQSLAAAERSVSSGIAATSLHALFLSAGDAQLPVLYEVTTVRDGRASHVRRVDAFQGERHLLTALASFHASQGGVEHAMAMPDVPPPEQLEEEDTLLRRAAEQLPPAERPPARPQRPIELRPVRPWNPLRPAETAEPPCTWVRSRVPLPHDQPLHRALIAYLSDFTLLRSALRPHGLSFQQDGVRGASIDHALWLHEDARVDEWLLYCTQSPQARHGRALTQGHLFARDGRLVASVAQEGIIRNHKEQPA